MSPELHVKSDVPPLAWDEFTSTHPIGSIALDGYVFGAPKYDAGGPYLNANHHEEVDRLATLSTAQQILMFTRMGLDKAFSTDGKFAPKVYVNDCDQDVCASWYLLNNISQTKQPSPTLNRFVHVAGTLDATAGAFPYDKDMPILGELAWVFEPYTSFRASGEMARKDNRQYHSVIQSVEHRIGQHLMGRGDSIALDLRYRKLGGGKAWTMFEETGRDGRTGAFSDGIDAYVTAQELPGNKWRYTIGRRSEFIPFDVPAIFDKLNEAEDSQDDKWGGATIVGGSPRVSGSKLTPDEVESVINAYLETVD